jgi:hypothetical protein
MKIFILVLTALACPAGIALAQAPEEHETISRSIVKLSPQHFTENSLKAGLERFNMNHSLSVAVFITGRMEKNEDSYVGEGYDGLAGELQVRKYISPMKTVTSKKNRTFNQGIYGAVYLQGGTYSGDFRGEYSYYDANGAWVTGVSYDYEDHVGNWGGGFTIGYQRTLWQVIFVEAFIGGGLQFSDRIITGKKPDESYFYYDSILDPYYRGILPKFGVNIGIGL